MTIIAIGLEECNGHQNIQTVPSERRICNLIHLANIAEIIVRKWYGQMKWMGEEYRRKEG
jgi:hypothetical protein